MRAAPHPILCAALLLTACGEGAFVEPRDPLDGLELITDDPTDLPLKGLAPAWRQRFDAGDVAFERVFREAEGLGPLYIRHACTSCHLDDARGPGKVTKMVVVEPDGVTPSADQSLLPWGHTERAQLTAGATQPIRAPEHDSVKVTTRTGPAVFGRGYIEAIADEEIERVEAEQARRDDGISGRIHRVRFASHDNEDTRFHAHRHGDDGLIGRFGLKARIATLDDFSADAYQGDMGLTSPMRPDEPLNPEGLDDDARPGLDLDADEVNLAADYVRLLAIPRRDTPDAAGEKLFADARCDVCHVPTLRTRADYPIELLAGIDAPVYTDLLLHDMGSDLADGLPDGDASGSEWRTAPLLGIRHLRSYLHDGRARTVEDAILLHEGPGSEANDSIARFRALKPEERERLVRFVESL